MECKEEVNRWVRAGSIGNRPFNSYIYIYIYIYIYVNKAGLDLVFLFFLKECRVVLMLTSTR